ncbi:MAG TPA: DUF4382 domain-containing protein [Gammaproteobacteria bacterium]|jgi:hypothetical protein
MKLTTLIMAFGLLALGGCNGGSSDGNINIDITDSPTDQATSVVVEFTGVVAQPAAGKAVSYRFPTPVQIDLAQLQDGTSASLLQNLQLPAGHYRWLELEVSATPGAKDSSVTLDSGAVQGLVLTAGGQASLRMASGFDVQANEGSSFIVDFDARRSVLPPAAGSTDFQLQPVLRMLDERAASNIVGSVPGNLAAAAGCVPVVYVYRGTDATPADLDSATPAATQPITEAPVALNTDFGAYRFTAAYLPAGTYTLAFTCDADKDDPTRHDVLNFSPVGTAVAQTGETTLTTL